MNCRNCGAQVKEGNKFCPKCGAPVIMENPEKGAAPSGNGGKKALRWIIPAACAAAAVIIVAVILLSQPKKIDLTDYVSVEFSGYDKDGEASVRFDSDGFASAVARALSKNEYELLLSEELLVCQQSFQYSLDRTSGLANGDEVTVTFTYDNEAVKPYKIQFTGDTAVYTVEGLPELEDMDPFEGLTVSFTGISPEGQVEYTYSGNSGFLDDYAFQCDKTDGLRNGETVTISVSESYEAAANEAGYRLAEKSREYTVEGLDEYVTGYAELTEDFLAHAKQETEDTVNAYIAQSYEDECSVSGLEYAGYVYQYIKEDRYGNYSNALYVIYRGTVSQNEGDFHDTMVYYPVCFYDILSDGSSLTAEGGEEVSGYSSLSGTAWGYSTDGYVNPITAYSELVTAYEDDYECEAGDGFEQYATYTPVSTLSDIAEDDMKVLTDRAKDVISSYIAEEYDEECKASELTLAGEYLLVSKAQGNDFAGNNRVIVVYSATVTHTENDFPATTVYYPVEFDGVVNLPGDEFIYTYESEVLGSSQFPETWYYTDGYLDGKKMFSDLVTANRTEYTYEVTEGLKAFGE
jgi:hypothetical protein